VRDGSARRWQVRQTFQYCRPAQVTNVTHTMMIFPVLGISFCWCWAGGDLVKESYR
jgi:hypothetical protein